MEIDITEAFNSIAPRTLSASVVEIGPDAGQITWRNAVAMAGECRPLDDCAKLDAFRAFVRGFGAWTPEEIAGWDSRECNAVLLQFVAAEMRDYGHDADGWDWQDYWEEAAQGSVGGRLSLGDDGRVYFSAGG